jgi:hypothetical protein
MIDLPSVGKASRQPDQVIQIIVGKNDRLEMKIKDPDHAAHAQGPGQRRQGRAG